jgi:hypothetical protein
MGADAPPIGAAQAQVRAEGLNLRGGLGSLRDAFIDSFHAAENNGLCVPIKVFLARFLALFRAGPFPFFWAW